MKNVREKVVCQAILYHLDFLRDCLWTSKGNRFTNFHELPFFHYYILFSHLNMNKMNL